MIVSIVGQCKVVQEMLLVCCHGVQNRTTCCDTDSDYAHFASDLRGLHRDPQSCHFHSLLENAGTYAQLPVPNEWHQLSCTACLSDLPMTELACHIDAIPESGIVCVVKQISHVCIERSVMDTGMDNFEFCVCCWAQRTV